MKFTNQNIIGIHVVTSGADDAQVYVVREQHSVNKAWYLLVYMTPRGIVSGGWCDISMMTIATSEQIRKYLVDIERIYAAENFVS